MRVKQDAIPGTMIPVWFVPTVTTEEMRRARAIPSSSYEIACAQLCGLGHYRMKGYMTIHSAEGFQKWMDEQQAELGGERGRRGLAVERNPMGRTHSGGLSRRQFVTRTASLAAATTILPRHVLGGPGVVAPSDKVNVAIIGVGGQGRTNFRALAQEDACQVIAVADPCEEWDLSPFYYGGKGGRGPVQAEIEKHYAEKTPNYRCADYEDFRVMLEKEKAIDAVLMRHARPSPRVRRHRRDEGGQARLLREAADAQHLGGPRSSPGWRRKRAWPRRWATRATRARASARPCEWIWDGAIGPVREVHAWSDTGGWAHGARAPRRTRRPCRPGFNWDLWLGPREHAPVPPGLRAVQLARLVGVRHRRPSATWPATTSTRPCRR